MKFKNSLKKILLPLFLLAFAVSAYIIWKVLNLPPEDELIQIAQTYFDKYGLITLFISAILEGVLLVGWYYPGSLVIFLGVIFAGKDVSRVIEAIGVITAGLTIAYSIDFFLGKYGWYKILLKFGLEKSLDSAKTRLKKYGIKAILFSFWHPNLAALTSTSAGILQFSFKKLFPVALIATIFWNTFWGTIVYLLGEISLTFIGIRFIVISITVWIFYKLWLSEKSSLTKVDKRPKQK